MKHKHIRFLITLAVLCTTILALPYFAIDNNTLYCRHTTLFWNPIGCYKFALRDQKADIVFVGDSSLAFGIRPNLLEKKTGLSAYNLGQPAGAMIFFPGLLLDHYLAHNERPHVIVLYVGPWTLLNHQDDMAHLWDDGARAALRHGSLAQIVNVLMSDPRRLLRVPVVFLHQGVRQFSLSDAWWHDASGEMRAARGYFPVWRPGRPFSMERPGGAHPIPIGLSDRCSLAIKPVGSPSRKQIQAFRDDYQRDGTRVLVYIAPIPQCDASYPAVVASYAGIADNRPQTLPGDDFINDGWRVHLTSSGARQATDQMADFILATLTAVPRVRQPHT